VTASAIAVLVAASLSGCAKQAGSRAGPELTFVTRTFEQKSPDCVPNGACAHIRIEYPEFSGGGSAAARESLQAFVSSCVLRSPGDSLVSAGGEASARRFLDGYARFHASFPASQMAWDADRRATQLPSPPGIYTLAARIFDYSGGAHPNTITRLASFDAPTGRRLKPGDVLTPGSDAQLLQLGEQAFRSARKLPPTSAFADSGYWFKNGFYLPSEFGITPQGLRFYFNEYEVAPYVMGPTDFTVPYSQLGGLIRSDGPLAAMIAKPRT